MWAVCSDHLLHVQRYFFLRSSTEEEESQYLRHIATCSPLGCILGCFVFFWPWTVWEAIALKNECAGGEELGWTRIAHYSGLALLTLAASLLTMVTSLTSVGRAQWLAEFMYMELLWVLLGAGGFTLLASSQLEESGLSPPSQEFLLASLSVVVLCCWPVRCQISWLTVLAAIVTSSIDARISWQNGTLLCGFLICVCRQVWMAEKHHRDSWRAEWYEAQACAPQPPAVTTPVLPMMSNSENDSSRGGTPALQSVIMDEHLFRQEFSVKRAQASQSLRCGKPQVEKTKSTPDSPAGIPGMVEAIVSRERSTSQDVFPAMSSRSEHLRWLILPLRQDFTVREVPFEVRLQLGYDIAGKHLSSVFDQTPDFDFQRAKEPFYCLQVHVRLATGPTRATLCLLRTGFVEPAWLAMLHSISEDLPQQNFLLPHDFLTSSDGLSRKEPEPGASVFGRRRSSPAVVNVTKVEVPSLKNLQQRMRTGPGEKAQEQKVGTLSSISGICDARLRYAESRSQMFTGSLAYSMDSSLPIQTNLMDFGGSADAEVQTMALGVEVATQTLQIGEARCRKCARPPRPQTKRRRPRIGSKTSPGPDVEMENEVDPLSQLSHAQALLMIIQGGWLLQAGPDDTAPWLQSFTINDYVAESQDDFIEITIENGKLVMAGGELALDEDGFLHRYGRSGSHLMYIRMEDPVFETGSFNSRTHRGSI